MKAKRKAKKRSRAPGRAEVPTRAIAPAGPRVYSSQAGGLARSQPSISVRLQRAKLGQMRVAKPPFRTGGVKVVTRL